MKPYKEIPICENCGCELTEDEIERQEKTCDDCNDPSQSVIN